MRLHDLWLRVTPYELALPGRAFVEEHFPSILSEVESRGVDSADPGRFVLLAAVGQALKEIRGEEEPPELIHQHGALLFHAWHFWRAGEPAFLLGTAAARELTGPRRKVPTGWRPALPAPAGYLQFPLHLFWVQHGEGSPPESVDGLFWAQGAEGSLSLLLVSGVIRDRPGFAVVDLPPFPLEGAGEWVNTRVRGEGEGEDFATALPGGEMDRLHSLETGGEVVKLWVRFLLLLDRSPERLGTLERSPGGEVGLERDPSSPYPSVLPWRRVGP